MTLSTEGVVRRRVHRDVDLSPYNPKVTRPEYERLKADVASGRIDAVVFWKLDRLARRTRDVIEVLDLLEEHAAAMASVQESFDTSTPHGQPRAGGERPAW